MLYYHGFFAAYSWMFDIFWTYDYIVINQCYLWMFLNEYEWILDNYGLILRYFCTVSWSLVSGSRFWSFSHVILDILLYHIFLYYILQHPDSKILIISAHPCCSFLGCVLVVSGHCHTLILTVKHSLYSLFSFNIIILSQKYHNISHWVH